MRKPDYGKIIYVELKNGTIGYYERFAYAACHNKKLKVYKGYRTLFPEMYDESKPSFISLKDIKYWKYVFPNENDTFEDCKGEHKERDLIKKTIEDYISCEKEYYVSHSKDLKVNIGTERQQDLAWNDWVEREPEKVCNFFTNWINGFWWSDGEIESPSHSVCLFWQAGFREAIRLFSEGKLKSTDND